jgi:hypothetical protein
MADSTAILATWRGKDRARAVLPADREIIEASGALRALIVDLVTSGGHEDELYDACAALGRLIAQRGGSPTFASATLDDAGEALEATAAAWLAPARAAVAEGFAATLAENARHDAMRAWEFPSCAVPLGEAAVAIAAGHPSDDDEEVSAWAARVAKAAALAGVRRAVVSGSERACAAVLDACGVVGIEAHLTPRAGRR